MEKYQEYENILFISKLNYKIWYYQMARIHLISPILIPEQG